MSQVPSTCYRPDPTSNDPIDTIVLSTVRVECWDASGADSCGSGFLFDFGTDGVPLPAIVTNRHVVFSPPDNGRPEWRATRGRLVFHTADSDGHVNLTDHYAVEFADLDRMWVCHPDVDLCAIPLSQLTFSGKRAAFACLTKGHLPSGTVLADIGPFEDVIMAGYPNGLWDSRHNLPLLRSGVTATHAGLPLNGKDEFLIDAGCYPGSSGSPVFLYRKDSYFTRVGGVKMVLLSGTPQWYLLGILYSGPETTIQGQIVTAPIPTTVPTVVPNLQAASTIPIHLGFVIQSQKLLWFEDYFRKFPPPTLTGIVSQGRA